MTTEFVVNSPKGIIIITVAMPTAHATADDINKVADALRQAIRETGAAKETQLGPAKIFVVTRYCTDDFTSKNVAVYSDKAAAQKRVDKEIANNDMWFYEFDFEEHELITR